MFIEQTNRRVHLGIDTIALAYTHTMISITISVLL